MKADAITGFLGYVMLACCVAGIAWTPAQLGQVACGLAIAAIQICQILHVLRRRTTRPRARS